MTRNSYAKSLRVKPQQVIPDKRDRLRKAAEDMDAGKGIERALHEIYDEEIERGLTDEERKFLDQLD